MEKKIAVDLDIFILITQAKFGALKNLLTDEQLKQYEEIISEKKNALIKTHPEWTEQQLHLIDIL